MAVCTGSPRPGAMFWMLNGGMWSVGVFHGDDDYFYNLFCGASATCDGTSNVVGELSTGECVCSAFVDMKRECAAMAVGGISIRLEHITHVETHPLSGCAPTNRWEKLTSLQKRW